MKRGESVHKRDKRIFKEKFKSCVEQVSEKRGDVSSGWAICTASLKGQPCRKQKDCIIPYLGSKGGNNRRK